MPIPATEYVSSIWKENSFKDKVVFCTGGNGTICSAQVRALVYLGASACIVGRSTEKTETVARDIATVRTNSRVLGIGGVDVRDFGALKTAFERCASELGGIDFVIAGAAGNFLAPISQLSSNGFKTVMDIDVLGSFNTAKLAIPYLLESIKTHPDTPSGRIIFISATIHYTGMPLQTHVCVAKAGVDALSANIAIEYGPLGLTSNVISPGPIGGTEGVRRLSKSKDQKEASGFRIPAGRLGSVRNISDSTVYLFSEAGDYVNGAALVVDGGAWRTLATITGTGLPYPENVLKVNGSRL